MKQRTILFFVGLILWANCLSAQQRPQFTQYMLNNFLQNPAIAGAYDYADLRLGFRNQWSGFEGAPRTLSLSGHTPINFGGANSRAPLPTIGTNYDETKEARGRTMQRGGNSGIRHGVGGMLFYDETQAMNRFMVYGSYALHIPVRTFYVSLGLHAGVMQYRQNNDRLNPLNPNDPAVGTGVSTSLIPDLGLGLWVYNDRFFGGAAFNQVLQNELSYSDVSIGPQNKLLMHYFLTGGYRFELSEQIDFIPSLMLKILEASPASWDINARFVYKNFIWLGGSYRHEDAVSGLLGFHLTNALSFNYSYDYTLSGLSDFNSGTHEISIGFKLNNNERIHNFF